MRPHLKLVPPKAGRSPFYYARGTYLGVYVERSTKTGDRKTAQKVLEKIREEIECGEFAKKLGPTFAGAAVDYMNDGGEREFLAAIIAEIGARPLGEIDGALIAKTAMRLYPGATPATRNRQVFTPVSAVLRHAGIVIVLKRPKGAQGEQRKHWLPEGSAQALLDAAWHEHPRFAALLTLLLYCGPRLSEALAIRIQNVHLDLAFIDLPHTKNDQPQRLHLPRIVVQALRIALMQPANASYTNQTLPRTSGSLFCLTKSGALYAVWKTVKEKAQKDAGIFLPDGVAFHLLRHTYGAWTRGAGVRLEETGRWTSRAGAKPYDHYEITDAGRVGDRFPGAAGGEPKKLKDVSG